MDKVNIYEQSLKDCQKAIALGDLLKMTFDLARGKEPEGLDEMRENEVNRDLEEQANLNAYYDEERGCK